MRLQKSQVKALHHKNVYLKSYNMEYLNFLRLEQVIHRSCGCPNPEGVQDHVGQDPGQPDLMGGTSTYGRGLEQDGL